MKPAARPPVLPSGRDLLPIPGFRKYAVAESADGWEVWSVAQGAWRTLKGTKASRDGRPQYGIRSDEGNPVTVQLGALVLRATAGPPPFADAECCHRNGDPFDNRPANLYWGTPKDNQADRSRHGRTYRAAGELSASHKLTAEDVRRIRATARRGRTGNIASLAHAHGVTPGCIYNVLNGASWNEC